MTIEDLLTGLRGHLAALGDGKDCKSDNEYATYRHAFDGAARLLSGLLNLPADLARLERELADLEGRRQVVVAKIADTERALLEAPPWREHHDARERDRRYDHIQHLRRQLERLHAGTLLYAPDRAYERLVDLDRRIAEWTKRRDNARAALDAHRAAAEALLAAQPAVSEVTS